jgi:hypothetical protein
VISGRRCIEFSEFQENTEQTQHADARPTNGRTLAITIGYHFWMDSAPPRAIDRSGA